MEGKKLILEFVPQSDVTYAIEHNKSLYESALEKQNIQKLVKEPKISENGNGKKAIVSDEPSNALDNLFRKTKTKPTIYFLPLSEEEVEQKRKKIRSLNNNKLI